MMQLSAAVHRSVAKTHLQRIQKIQILWRTTRYWNLVVSGRTIILLFLNSHTEWSRDHGFMKSTSHFMSKLIYQMKQRSGIHQCQVPITDQIGSYVRTLNPTINIIVYNLSQLAIDLGQSIILIGCSVDKHKDFPEIVQKYLSLQVVGVLHMPYGLLIAMVLLC